MYGPSYYWNSVTLYWKWSGSAPQLHCCKESVCTVKFQAETFKNQASLRLTSLSAFTKIESISYYTLQKWWRLSASLKLLCALSLRFLTISGAWTPTLIRSLMCLHWVMAMHLFSLETWYNPFQLNLLWIFNRNVHYTNFQDNISWQKFRYFSS